MSYIERSEQLKREISDRLADLVQIVRDVKNAPGGGRRHWVFAHPCGCVYGVLDAGDAGGSEADRAVAWASYYEGASPAGFAMMARGATLTLADHDYYLEHFAPQLDSAWRCPHKGGAG